MSNRQRKQRHAHIMGNGINGYPHHGIASNDPTLGIAEKNPGFVIDAQQLWAGHKMEIGLGKIEVIANGIPSKPRLVLILPNFGDK